MSFNTAIFVSNCFTNLSAIYLSIYPLSKYKSINLLTSFLFRSIFSIYLSSFLSILSFYLSIYLSILLSIYLCIQVTWLILRQMVCVLSTITINNSNMLLKRGNHINKYRVDNFDQLFFIIQKISYSYTDLIFTYYDF